jgi:two-component system cell cycle response regulator
MSEIVALIIDDSEQIHREVTAALPSQVVDRLLHAMNPGDGIRMALEHRPDLILLDINMPNMDGLKVCRHLKEAEATRDVPVLFLTIESNVSSLARALDCGGADYILKPFNEIDLRARVRVALRTKRMIDLLKEQARIDALTGLSNRAGLDTALSSSVAAHERLGQPFALLMLDIDRFKKINDEHGHGVGDDVLREIAASLRLGCRPYDTPCRFGGDEFGIVLDQTEGEHARTTGVRILERIRLLTPGEARSALTVSCSAGVASTAELRPGFTVDDIVKAADAALYRAKRDGRDRLRIAGPDAP